MNVAFGRCEYDQIRKEDVQASIDLAMLQSVIDHMPNGIDTRVGYGGNLLSGGQRQRAAIARARLRDAPVLILDEPTSALDGKNRTEVIRAIRDWRKGKTTIIITHDMSHILDNDFTYILDQGLVVQAGYRFELEKIPANERLFPSSNIRDDSAAEDEDGHTLPYSRQAYSMLSEATLVSSWEKPSGRSGRASKYLSSGPESPLDEEKTLERSNRNEDRMSKHSETMSLYQIVLTIIPNLAIRQQISLLLGCLFTLCHASCIPVFSYCLARLQGTFFDLNSSALIWTLIALGVSICDGVVSFFMHYLLSVCGQAWVDCLRKRAFRRVLDQPREWFEEEANSPSQLTTRLTRDGEEMRDILGRFGGYALVAASISVIATVWSLAVCWKLTLVTIGCGPVIYAITRGFEGATGLWDTRCSETRSAASEIFVETFSEIRTVRALTLEPFFNSKHMKAVLKGLTTGLRRAFYTGFLFGLVESIIIFVSGR
jgi:ATP-binding cassette subfamily B (MDR/TAP) protein 1